MVAHALLLFKKRFPVCVDRGIKAGHRVSDQFKAVLGTALIGSGVAGLMHKADQTVDGLARPAGQQARNRQPHRRKRENAADQKAANRRHHVHKKMLGERQRCFKAGLRAHAGQGMRLAAVLNAKARQLGAGARLKHKPRLFLIKPRHQKRGQRFARQRREKNARRMPAVYLRHAAKPGDRPVSVFFPVARHAHGGFGQEHAGGLRA